MGASMSSGIDFDRNQILQEFAESSFEQALEEVSLRLTTEKNSRKRLALLAAKSWLLRHKITTALHDPYIYSINEVENTDVFDDLEDDEDTEIDKLFDDEPTSEELVEVQITKNTSIDGSKLAKGVIAKVTRANADKLISEVRRYFLKTKRDYSKDWILPGDFEDANWVFSNANTLLKICFIELICPQIQYWGSCWRNLIISINSEKEVVPMFTKPSSNGRFLNIVNFPIEFSLRPAGKTEKLQ